MLNHGASISTAPVTLLRGEASLATQRIAPLLLAFLLQLPIAGQAASYTGGPLLVDVLGWDSQSHRVYFRTNPADESYRFGGVYYFATDSKQPSQRVEVAWSKGGASADDPERNRMLRSLRRRLTSLRPQPSACLGWGTKILSADSVRSPAMGVRARFRLRYTSSDLVRFECTAFGSPEVCLKNVYAIPGSKAVLYVLAFRGDLLDVAETQVAVLVPRARAKRFAWNGYPTSSLSSLARTRCMRARIRWRHPVRAPKTTE